MPAAHNHDEPGFQEEESPAVSSLMTGLWREAQILNCGERVPSVPPTTPQICVSTALKVGKLYVRVASSRQVGVAPGACALRVAWFSKVGHASGSGLTGHSDVAGTPPARPRIEKERLQLRLPAACRLILCTAMIRVSSAGRTKDLGGAVHVPMSWSGPDRMRRDEPIVDSPEVLPKG